MARPLPTEADLRARGPAIAALAGRRPNPDKAAKLTDRQLGRILRRVIAPSTSALEAPPRR